MVGAASDSRFEIGVLLDHGPSSALDLRLLHLRPSATIGVDLRIHLVQNTSTPQTAPRRLNSGGIPAMLG